MPRMVEKSKADPDLQGPLLRCLDYFKRILDVHRILYATLEDGVSSFPVEKERFCSMAFSA